MSSRSDFGRYARKVFGAHPLHREADPFRELLPLPAPHCDAPAATAKKESERGGEKSDRMRREQLRYQVRCWLWCLVVCSNFTHYNIGGDVDSFVYYGPCSAAQARALDDMGNSVKYFLTHSAGAVPRKDWVKELAKRSVSYTGEELTTAQPLSWEQMEPALPPLAATASIPAIAIATGTSFTSMAFAVLGTARR